jgi:cytochrome c peroxidase
MTLLKGGGVVRVFWMILIFFSVALIGCGQNRNGNRNGNDLGELERLARLSMEVIPRAPTNLYADRAGAARFGQRLFFTNDMSSTGGVSCASCHDPEHGFSEARALAQGVNNRVGSRHSPTLWNVAFSDFYFWDGRADSLWSQALQAIEGFAEMNFSRLEVAHMIVDRHAREYESVFGPLPTISNLPRSGKPGDALWNGISNQEKNDVQRIFANVGKALEAYQRQLICSNTRFDRYIRGEINLTQDEERGASDFIDSGCDRCHSGPTLSDNRFHNIGIDHNGAPDRGRIDGISSLVGNIFNGTGDYSDDVGAGFTRLNPISSEANQLGAFKTPTLRGVGQRSHFGHLGSFITLRQMINHYNRGGRNNRDFVGQLDPLLNNVNVRGEEDIEVFLRTLDCPPLPDSMLGVPPPF